MLEDLDCVLSDHLYPNLYFKKGGDGRKAIDNDLKCFQRVRLVVSVMCCHS